MFAILISTKNRKHDLIFTLNQIRSLVEHSDVQTVVFDDGSTDGTSEAVKEQFPQIKLKRNDSSKGYMYCRNTMLNGTDAEYAISLDDDAHFISENPLDKIKTHFDENPNCGVIAFRIFWGKNLLENNFNNESHESVNGFVGCGHCWRMNSWRQIPNYPEWFGFYGEEDFASLSLFKKNWQVQYVPQIAVQHRVDLNARKSESDFVLRLRKSLSTGWYLYFLFMPLHVIPKKMAYSIWMQLKKVFAGNSRVFTALSLAIFDLLMSIPNIIKHRTGLSIAEYKSYMKLPQSKVYWKPKEQ